MALEKLPTSPDLIAGETIYHQRKASPSAVGADLLVVGLTLWLRLVLPSLGPSQKSAFCDQPPLNLQIN